MLLFTQTKKVGFTSITKLKWNNSSASNHPILVFLSCPQVSGKWKKPKINYITADDYTDKIRVWQASRIFDFVNEFFPQKIQHEVLSLGIQLILSILWLWHLKISGKSIKKMVKKCKNNTKNGITWVWNELRPKLQQLAFNKGHFEKVVLTSAVTTWYLTMSPFVPEKRPNSTKVNYNFY